jgi:ribosomal protein S18 acetylase RimI-like enzyme
MAEIRPFSPADLDEVLALCAAERWNSWTADRERAGRRLTAPGVTTMVAADAAGVIGFAQMLSDGEVQAYLAVVVVDRERRRRGIARALIVEAAKRAGVGRVDLLSEEEAQTFYERFAHRRLPGFRIYAEPSSLRRP